MTDRIPQRSDFTHSNELIVRSYHVDAQRVVHNGWYLFFFEEGRVEYFRALGMLLDEETFVTHARFQVAMNTCTYHSPATFDETLVIYTRVAFVKNSSFGVEHLIEEKRTQRLVAAGSGIIVYQNAKTGKSERLPDEMRERIRAYEGSHVAFLSDPSR